MTAVSNALVIVAMPLNVAFWNGIHPAVSALLKTPALDPLQIVGHILLIICLPFVLGLWCANRFAQRGCETGADLQYLQHLWRPGRHVAGWWAGGRGGLWTAACPLHWMCGKQEIARHWQGACCTARTDHGVDGFLGRGLVAALARHPVLDKMLATDVRAVPAECQVSGVQYLEQDVRDGQLSNTLAQHRIKTEVHIASFVAPGKGSSRASNTRWRQRPWLLQPGG